MGGVGKRVPVARGGPVAVAGGDAGVVAEAPPRAPQARRREELAPCGRRLLRPGHASEGAGLWGPRRARRRPGRRRRARGRMGGLGAGLGLPDAQVSRNLHESRRDRGPREPGRLRPRRRRRQDDAPRSRLLARPGGLLHPEPRPPRLGGLRLLLRRRTTEDPRKAIARRTPRQGRRLSPRPRHHRHQGHHHRRDQISHVAVQLELQPLRQYVCCCFFLGSRDSGNTL
mmetsp:Transcript_27162/g.87770  ORF Transcript_27162/g.87770 Transcript_27162/m.87770 type:complete len:228 (+) Transcript_27162:1068-1751(+)